MKERMETIKILVTLILLVAAASLAYMYLFPPSPEFVPGSEVNYQTFTHILGETDSVNIMMDIREVENPDVRWAILQCGVDFAGSPGLIDKNVNVLSLDEDGCVAEDGRHERDYCFERMRKDLTLYIQPGNTTSFHSNAMVVGVKHDYLVGLCSINRR
jgi:hypothetical protein